MYCFFTLLCRTPLKVLKKKKKPVPIDMTQLIFTKIPCNMKHQRKLLTS